LYSEPSFAAKNCDVDSHSPWYKRPVWSLVRAKQLADIQDQLIHIKDGRLELDLKAKDEKIAEAGERAALADKRAGEANIAAADAKAAQQRVETDLAKQQERAATAEKDLLELKERIKPRRLTDKQSADFVAVLSRLPNTVLKLGWTAGGGDEGFKLLQQLMPLFRQARWKVPEATNEVSNHFDIQVTGIALLIPGPEGSDVRKPEPTTMIQLNPAQTTLQAAFKTVGIDLQFQRWFHTEDSVPELVIGSKPNP
jgi:hypothetical protein